VVTGASTGIGEACALHLAGRGFRVFAGVRKAQDGERLRSSSDGGVEPLTLDVTDGASIEAAAKEVATALGERGRLAGLVNNAGIAVAGPLEFIPIDALRRQFEVNAVGPVAVSQAFLAMLRRSRGRIVHMGSISGKVATPFAGPYCASKFALEAIADAMRMELKPWGIHVSLVEPGPIDTPIWDKSRAVADAMLDGAPAEVLELYGSAIPKMQAAAERTAAAGIAPSQVAGVVFRALTDARPKARYVVGRDAKVQSAVVRRLPDAARDTLIRRFIGL
jgi:NAD(P)-dependent dehydrogenase (short-subunit alcohol dehydrogenase family)